MFLGLVIVIIGFIIESIIVILSEKISILLRKKPFVSRIIDKLFGTALIGLGVKLVLEEKD
jgi:threonine/homoserine/homoserine lactone efflux protein